MDSPYTDLKHEVFFFLVNHNCPHYGIEGPIRGSKCCSVYIRKTDKERFENLHGLEGRYHRFYFSPMYEFNDCIKYNINCVRK